MRDKRARMLHEYFSHPVAYDIIIMKCLAFFRIGIAPTSICVPGGAYGVNKKYYLYNIDGGLAL